MEFLVEFESHIPDGTSKSEVKARYSAEAAASAKPARDGHLVRLWRPPMAPGERKALGLYRADGKEQLDDLRRGQDVTRIVTLVRCERRLDQRCL